MVESENQSNELRSIRFDLKLCMNKITKEIKLNMPLNIICKIHLLFKCAIDGVISFLLIILVHEWFMWYICINRNAENSFISFVHKTFENQIESNEYILLILTYKYI